MKPKKRDSMPSDIEMAAYGSRGGDSFGQGSSWSFREPFAVGRVPTWARARHRQEPRLRTFLDSFKRDPVRRISTHGIYAQSHPDQYQAADSSDEPPTEQNHGSHYFDLHAANVRTANTGLARELKGRHLQMIAIGGSVGSGLFVASGKCLYLGGPASLIIAYGFVGVMLWCTIQALGELAVAFPVAGSFSSYSTRFLDPAWGFAMGWNYALQWLTVLPLELIAASITIGYWNDQLNKAIFITIFLATVIIINLFGVKGYGEAEFVFSIVKIAAVTGFIILAAVINIGGFDDPQGNTGYIGGRYWTNPGAFHHGFKGLCSVFVSAAFAFTGTELVGLAAAETANPRKSLPTAIKQVFWRITLFYIVSLTLVGLIVPYNHERLLGNIQHYSVSDASYSPFVIAIESASIQVLPGIMNAVILIAVLSVGNSAVFGSSRTLAALADQRQAPQILAYVDRKGRPLFAILFAALVGLIGYLADLKFQSDVLNWLLAVSGLSSIFTWGSICLCHIRFRRAWARRGRSLTQLSFTAQAGITGSYVGLFLNVFVLIAQFWIAAFPIVTFTDNQSAATASPSKVAQSFFLQYLCVPIVVAFYLVYKLWFRTKIVRSDEMDLDTGRRRDVNLPVLVMREKEEVEGWPGWKRVYRFFC
ncbi:general amino-acid permease GAP1 [Neurospora crassa]|uniref:General amino-acid permease GAP1 n=1 Tax=Neurospora crassa (strain ATCC 24698 / 74-OR23-1A / CBS 708.71 / DSM 1257 / FGSC 987) TaxID=367110 RepID=Q7SE11_NEUCR|nr:general amino-acid permease GAP1 [Neurospora crassa OR74A]EAA35042.3 general amino-acid permease GAP1 [Neurospora crassa OR74A]KHE87298.1 general amino-acid permease GAP1 [Neurospora crassa]|eukprot:XP_964278.3 general amino-acid permease GAP1 [Neurospora crassa OR74A]